MRIAIGFWGLTRCLKDHTIESIRKNVFDVLSDGGVEYDVFIHTYEKGEGDVVADCKLLAPMRCEIHKHDDVVPVINFSKYRTQPDPWDTSYRSVDNFLLAMWSKSRLTKLIASSGIQYDRVVYMRPDTLCLTPLSPIFLAAARDGAICISDHDRCSQHKMNDRFAICTWNNFQAYGDVFRFLYGMSKVTSLHSETILGSILQGYGFNVIPIPFYFYLFRAKDGARPRDVDDVLSRKLAKLTSLPVLKIEPIGNDGVSCSPGPRSFRFIPT